MKISLMRNGSLGLAGTLKNANHHAPKLVKLINQLVSEIPRTVFVEWVQGHNVHWLVTQDGRKFVLRPLCITRQRYVGITLGLRVGRGNEHHLCTIYHDRRNGIGPKRAAWLLQALAEAKPEFDQALAQQIAEGKLDTNPEEF